MYFIQSVINAQIWLNWQNVEKNPRPKGNKMKFAIQFTVETKIEVASEVRVSSSLPTGLPVDVPSDADGRHHRLLLDQAGPDAAAQPRHDPLPHSALRHGHLPRVRKVTFKPSPVELRNNPTSLLHAASLLLNYRVSVAVLYNIACESCSSNVQTAAGVLVG